MHISTLQTVLPITRIPEGINYHYQTHDRRISISKANVRKLRQHFHLYVKPWIEVATAAWLLCSTL
jgi:hypothetical protein